MSFVRYMHCNLACLFILSIVLLMNKINSRSFWFSLGNLHPYHFLVHRPTEQEEKGFPLRYREAWRPPDLKPSVFPSWPVARWVTCSMSQAQWAAGSEFGSRALAHSAHCHQFGMVETKWVSTGRDSTVVKLHLHWWVRVSSANRQRTERADPSGSSAPCPLGRSSCILKKFSIRIAHFARLCTARQPCPHSKHSEGLLMLEKSLAE